MPSVTSSIDIASLPHAVWDLVSDPKRYPEWVEVTDRMIDVPAEALREGSIYTEYAGLWPFKSESTWRITAFEPHRRQVHLGDDGTAEVELTMLIEPTDEGSRFTQTLDLRFRGVAALLMVAAWPLVMRRRMQRAVDRSVANARDLTETAAR